MYAPGNTHGWLIDHRYVVAFLTIIIIAVIAFLINLEKKNSSIMFFLYSPYMQRLCFTGEVSVCTPWKNLIKTHNLEAQGFRRGASESDILLSSFPYLGLTCSRILLIKTHHCVKLSNIWIILYLWFIDSFVFIMLHSSVVFFLHMKRYAIKK